jgi:hypothetical protein
MSGQRRAFDRMMPFSVENWSLGRPKMFHERILTWSPRVVDRLNWAEREMLLDSTNLHQSWTWSLLLLLLLLLRK